MLNTLCVFISLASFSFFFSLNKNKQLNMKTKPDTTFIIKMKAKEFYEL